VREEQFSIFVKVSLASVGVEASELAAGWRILVGTEFQRKSAAITLTAFLR